MRKPKIKQAHEKYSKSLSIILKYKLKKLMKFDCTR